MVPDVYFWEPQDGEIEKEFKRNLCASQRFLDLVREAYLVRVRYSGSEVENVALCLVAGRDDEKILLDIVNKTFRPMFGASTSLDTIFLSAEQLAKIRAVAQPFWRLNDSGQ